MPDQLTLFDPSTFVLRPRDTTPAVSVRPGASCEAPGPSDEATPADARRAELAAEAEARLVALRARYAELSAQCPGSPPDAATVARLARLGLTYLCSYAVCEESLYAVEGVFTAAGERTVLVKTGPGLAAAIETMEARRQ